MFVFTSPLSSPAEQIACRFFSSKRLDGDGYGNGGQRMGDQTVRMVGQKLVEVHGLCRYSVIFC